MRIFADNYVFNWFKQIRFLCWNEFWAKLEHMDKLGIIWYYCDNLDVYFEILYYIFKVYWTVKHSFTFTRSQMITILFNHL